MADYSLFGDDHVAKYEDTGGSVGHDWNDTTCLILRAKGRKTGELRKNPLIYGRDGESFVLIASKGRGPRPPRLVQKPAREPGSRDPSARPGHPGHRSHWNS